MSQLKHRKWQEAGEVTAWGSTGLCRQCQRFGSSPQEERKTLRDCKWCREGSDLHFPAITLAAVRKMGSVQGRLEYMWGDQKQVIAREQGRGCFRLGLGWWQREWMNMRRLSRYWGSKNIEWRGRGEGPGRGSPGWVPMSGLPEEKQRSYSPRESTHCKKKRCVSWALDTLSLRSLWWTRMVMPEKAFGG